jgi:hypothetical protein
MHIAVVGGREKDEENLSRIAKDAGYDLEFETGHVRGRGVEGIRTAVSRSDLVVIVTDINSHGAVHVAKRAAQRFHKPTLIVTKFSAMRLKGLIEALDRRKTLVFTSGSELAQRSA